MKKAMMALSRLIMIIVAVVALMMLMYLTGMIGGVMEKTQYDTACKTSVVAFSKLSRSQKILTLGSNTGQADQKMVDCPTRYTTFKKRTSRTDQTAGIAEMMAHCYNMYGEGKVPLLPVSNEVFCGICDVFDFQDQSQVLTGLPFYLMTYHIKYKVSGDFPTYFEYMTGKKANDTLLAEWRSNTAGSLSGSKRYAIIYLYLQFGGAKLVYNKLTSSPGNMLLGIASPTNFMFSSEMMGDIASLKNKEGGSIALIEYNEESLKSLSCSAIPFSQMEKKFR